MNAWIRNGAVFFFGALVSTGCAPLEDREDDDVADADDASEETELVTSTTIEIDAEGNVHVLAEEHVARDVMNRELAARRALAVTDRAAGVGSASQPIVSDAACDAASLWLFDQPYDGAGNNPGRRLCIKSVASGGSGGPLSAVCRTWIPSVTPGKRLCTSTWSGAVKAYYPGSDLGYFSAATSSCDGLYGVETFDAWSGPRNAGACGRAANAVSFSPFIF